MFIDKFKKVFLFTANGGRVGAAWKSVEPLSAIAIEGHVWNGRRISSVETARDDEEVVVAVEGSPLTHVGRHSSSRISS